MCKSSDLIMTKPRTELLANHRSNCFHLVTNKSFKAGGWLTGRSLVFGLSRTHFGYLLYSQAITGMPMSIPLVGHIFHPTPLFRIWSQYQTNLSGQFRYSCGTHTPPFVAITKTHSFRQRYNIRSLSACFALVLPSLHRHQTKIMLF